MNRFHLNFSNVRIAGFLLFLLEHIFFVFVCIILLISIDLVYVIRILHMLNMNLMGRILEYSLHTITGDDPSPTFEP